MAEIEALEALLNQPVAIPPFGKAADGSERIQSNFSKADYLAAVDKAKEHIKAGDIFQAVLSQRFTAEVTCDPFNVYRALRIVNPSPYMFFLKLGECSVIGSSPEMLVRIVNGKAYYRPIAGTRPRGANEDEDALLAEELKADEKEKAEHIMLVDLGRNDLGRVCEFGSVEVLDLMLIEKYSHVMHLVSSLRGDLRKISTGLTRSWPVSLREPSPALQRCGPWRSSTHWNRRVVESTQERFFTWTFPATWTRASPSGH